MNNDTFSIKRLGLLLQKDIQENWKRYLMYMATLYGGLTIVLSLIPNQHIEHIRYAHTYHHDLIELSCILFFICGLFFTSTMMTPMNNKTKRIAFLSNPSSSFEKFLYRWLIVTVVYFIVFFVTINLADITRVVISSIRFPDAEVSLIDFNKTVGANDYSKHDNEYLFSPEIFKLMIAFYFLLHSIFVLGATFWPKNSFIKTFSACLILILSYVFMADSFTHLLLGAEEKAAFNQFLNPYSDLIESSTTPEMLIPLVFYILAITMYILSYFRFKESEVINRW